MNELQPTTKITVTCPSGHRLRGGTLLIGKSVCCPKCHTEFVFALGSVSRTDHQAVTDTGVMRILGEMPGKSQKDFVAPPVTENVRVSDTGVIRILSETGESTQPPREAEVLRPCSRCGVPIPETLAVCNHCNCYVGVLPSFLNKMTSIDNQHH